ncbi:hypothetical protein BKA59DRAFT_271513 [Fusarium tricinctum]|uniref:Secreted protein n=1 Tax=Fusarium tricinctum TaxID=61284 RepID=A0A8K0RP15_9HYPO|nr:hypothetical protein BKA59DRAFT_271513 [Fusarium tricinctum]
MVSVFLVFAQFHVLPLNDNTAAPIHSQECCRGCECSCKPQRGVCQNTSYHFPAPFSFSPFKQSPNLTLQVSPNYTTKATIASRDGRATVRGVGASVPSIPVTPHSHLHYQGRRLRS